MNVLPVLYSIIKADFQERTRRSSFLATLCLVLYLGYAVNTGQILIKLGAYRGVYNSAWVGSLMAMVITFLLGLTGFYLVKNTIERDERTSVGQILATTSLTRPLYLLGKWLSNMAVLSTLVVLLALAAILMQLIQREEAQIQLWSLIAPFLFIALPMMALVSAFAVFFETVRWLKGGFGNLVYFSLFIFLLVIGIFLPQWPWMDVIGFNLVGSSMKAAAKAAFPAYDGSFIFAMISGKPLQTFAWPGMNWSVGLIFQRLMWLVVSFGVAQFGSLFFDRFDINRIPRSSRNWWKGNGKQLPIDHALTGELASDTGNHESAPLSRPLTRLMEDNRFHINVLRLVWLECLLLLKGLKWYWLLGMAAFWVCSAAVPSEGIRKYGFMLTAIWPVLVWSKMGEREARYQAEQMIYQAAHPLIRLLVSAWTAGVLITAGAASGVLLGRLIYEEPIGLLSWILSILFIPTLALTLGIWSRSSKLFEVVYPILWYLGPFNPQNGLAILDYLGIHAQAPVNASPMGFAGGIALLMLIAFIGRRRQIMA